MAVGRKLQVVRPSAAIDAWLRRQLSSDIVAMHKTVLAIIASEYASLQHGIVSDESPADKLNAALRHLSVRWIERFDRLSTHLAVYFAKAIEQRSTAALKRMLARSGFSVKFQTTPAMRSIIDATVHESVALIKSIPRQYFTQVEGIVMRGVQVGRDLHVVSRALQEQLGVTKRRADFIARDQNNKATAALNRARQLEAGLDEAIWIHSGGGKTKRPTHAAAGRDGVRFSIARGWFDPDPAVRRYIQPGELINCRCVSRPVLKGFT